MNMFLNVFNTKFFSTECGSFKNHCHSLLSDLSDFQLQGLGFLSILDSRYHSTGGVLIGGAVVDRHGVFLLEGTIIDQRSATEVTSGAPPRRDLSRSG